MQWRKVALETRSVGIPVQSGTGPVERLWSGLDQMLPREARCMSLRWFNIMSRLMYVRVNIRHFAARCHPAFAEKDPLIAQRLQTMSMLVAAVAEIDGASHLQPLFEPFVV